MRAFRWSWQCADYIGMASVAIQLCVEPAYAQWGSIRASVQLREYETCLLTSMLRGLLRLSHALDSAFCSFSKAVPLSAQSYLTQLLRLQSQL